MGDSRLDRSIMNQGKRRPDILMYAAILMCSRYSADRRLLNLWGEAENRGTVWKRNPTARYRHLYSLLCSTLCGPFHIKHKSGGRSRWRPPIGSRNTRRGASAQAYIGLGLDLFCSFFEIVPGLGRPVGPGHIQLVGEKKKK